MGGGEGGGWDDLEIPDDMMVGGEEGGEGEEKGAGGRGEIPQAGMPMNFGWCRNSRLAVHHAGYYFYFIIFFFYFFFFLLYFILSGSPLSFIFLISPSPSSLLPPSLPPPAAGSFESAMDIMNKTTGIVNFTPLKAHFMNAYCASRVPLSGVASGVPLTVFMQDVFFFFFFFFFFSFFLFIYFFFFFFFFFLGKRSYGCIQVANSNRPT